MHNKKLKTKIRQLYEYVVAQTRACDRFCETSETYFLEEKLRKLRLSCGKSAEIGGALPPPPRVDLEGMGGH